MTLATTKPATIRTWVEALRSGDYEPGRGFLCRGNAFCALGVLIEVAFDGYWTSRDDELWACDGDAQLLTPQVLQQLGIPQWLADLVAEGSDTGDTFEDIAEFIEAATTDARRESRAHRPPVGIAP